MTFSILARDPETGHLGVATATGKIAVGAQVPHLRSGIGAIATQGFTTNPLYAEEGFQLLEDGQSVSKVVQALVGCDQGRDWRQVIVIDRFGRTAGATGSANEAVMGHVEEDDLAIAGNMLAGDGVLPAMRAAYLGVSDRPLAIRLLEALKAGEEQGGDKRGTCSAAMKVQDDAPWPLDLRVDFAADPLSVLEDLYGRSTQTDYVSFRQSLPGR